MADNPLAPVHAALVAAFGPDPPPLIARDLVVDDTGGWLPSTGLVDGAFVPDLLAAVAHRRGASPHAAAALGWKAYSYAVALPAVLGWAAARRVPLVRPGDVLFRLSPPRAVLTVGLRPSIHVAVLASDPLTRRQRGDVEVVAGERELLDALRCSLLDAHLDPVLANIRAAVRVGARALLGSLANGVCHAVLDAADALPGPAAEHIATLLSTFGVADLVDLMPGPAGRPVVQRRTCCLAFTLPTPHICAGCCLRRSFT
jgi:hypothetical protein